jgi:DNA-binding XRE family transcriptional regulator
MTADEMRQARQTLGLTQEQFGRIFDVAPRTVSAWENGARDGRASQVPRSIAVLVRLAVKDQRVRRELGISSPNGA